MKITSLELENVKRIKAVRMEPSPKGLTIIGGKNGQGKTSVLDAIAYAFGGEKFRPSNLKRDEAVGDAFIHVETDDGFIIERKGPKSALTVSDPSGLKGGQKILDELVGKYAIDLPKFMSASDTEKAKMLLDILGIGPQIEAFTKEEKAKYNERLALGRIAEQKKKAAAEMPEYHDVPDLPLSVAELMERHKAILAKNAENERLRQNAEQLRCERDRLAEQIEELQKKFKDLSQRAYIACKTADELHDESTVEIEANIADYEATNRKIHANQEKARITSEANDLQEAYDGLTKEIDKIRADRLALLNGADLPYPGLTVEDGRLMLNGKNWDCMSGAEQLTVACAISLALNPRCRMVLMDKLEQFDEDTLAAFDKWAAEHDIQAITTRVSTGAECTLIIEDGEVAETPKTTTTDNWEY